MNRRKFLQMSAVSVLSLHPHVSLSSIIESSQNQAVGILNIGEKSEYAKEAIIKVFKESLTYIEALQLSELENYFSDGYLHPDDRMDHAGHILYHLQEMCVYYDEKWTPLWKHYQSSEYDDKILKYADLLDEFYRDLPNIITSLNSHGDMLYSEYKGENDIRLHIDDYLLQEAGVDDLTMEYCHNTGLAKFFYKNSVEPVYILSDSGLQDLNLLDSLSEQHKNKIQSVQQCFLKSLTGFDVNNKRDSFVHLIVDNALDLQQAIAGIKQNLIFDTLLGDDGLADENTEEVLLLENNTDIDEKVS